MTTWALLEGDCVAKMREIEDGSIDCLVTDPPYGIGFMGHEWDQPGDFGPVRSMGTPGPFASGKPYPGEHAAGGLQAQGGQRRTKQPAPAGYDRNGDAARVGAKTVRQRETPSQPGPGQSRRNTQGPGGEREGAKFGGPTGRNNTEHALRGGAMHAGRYDLSAAANRRFQAWCEAWAVEAFRVLKPGGYLLSFGGTRTYHRMASGIEDAGFEVRDCLVWLFGSGFPKSLDVPKAIDRAAGAEGSWRQEDHPGRPGTRHRSDKGGAHIGQTYHVTDENPDGLRHVYEPESEAAREWAGFGTALKPGHEPIIVARKPLIGTVVANVLEHGTGALNIDACRIGFQSEDDEREAKEKNRHADFDSGPRNRHGIFKPDDRTGAERDGNYDAPGRWPTNVALGHAEDCKLVGSRVVKGDGHFPGGRGPSGYGSGALNSNGGGLKGQDGLEERHLTNETVETWLCVPGCPVLELDRQSGSSRSTGGGGFKPKTSAIYGEYGGVEYPPVVGFGDQGGASRFFYSAKAARSERESGLVGNLPCSGCGETETLEHELEDGRKVGCARNDHPTVKPIGLMRWLVRLVCPPGGKVLDPFAGSGTTGAAAVLEGFDFVGIDRGAEYLTIAEHRIAYWADPTEHDARLAELRHAAEEATAIEEGRPVQLGLEL